MYKKWDNLQKARQFILHLHIYIYKHFTLLNFSWEFWSWHSIQKAWHLAIGHIFIYKNPNTLQNARQFALRFYIQKACHFAFRDYSWNFWNWQRCGGGGLFKKKGLCDIFVFANNNALSSTFVYENKIHFVSRYIYKNQDTLR